MAIDKELFGPQSEGEKEIFALESLVFSVQVALQRAMTKQGVSAKELAERLGMTPARVSQIFSDKGPNLTLRTIAKIQAALGEDFAFVSKSEMKAQKPMSTAKLYALFSGAESNSPWQEVKASNLNRKAVPIAA